MIEPLTETEAAKLDAGKCPDCGGAKFLEGPHGGINVNIMCADCGSKFNVVPGIGGPFGKQRIGRPVILTLRKELIAWLDLQHITSSNIGRIRSQLFVPWTSDWNAIVRDETAKRENKIPTYGSQS